MYPFETINRWRPQFFGNIMGVAVINRMRPVDADRNEQMQAERANHLRLATEQLDILERAYAADIERMREIYNRVADGGQMDAEPQAA